VTDFLKPKTSGARKINNPMENGLFRNPPTYTQLGGFTSVGKLTDPTGKRNGISGMSLERGGPTSRKGQPI